MISLGILVPCYNEEEVLEETTSQLLKLLARLQAAGKVEAGSGIYYIDDGSTDGTWHLIESLSEQHAGVEGIKLSRNTGHQNALLAGLFTVNSDVLVSLDADLQDDIDAIEKMLVEYDHGAEIVYGVRENRGSDTTFKRTTAQCFYRIMQIMGVGVVSNHADFRLLGRRAVEALKDFEEVNLFLRGIIPLIGFRSATVQYKRNPRFAGQSKYSLGKMIAFALEGITSFTIFPLRLITVAGFLVFMLSMLMGLYVLFIKLATNAAVPGWASTVLPIYILGGIQIFFIGILGEYTGKMYKEVKRRPRYVIEKTTEENRK